VRALVNTKPPRLVLDHPEPARAPDEALIRLRIAGVCDTDLELAKGYLGFEGVLGHEFVGDVVEASDASWVGKRVVGDINAGCGVCADCATARGHHCAARTVLGITGRDGALAEHFVLPERALVAVPDAVTDEQAVFAEPLAAALHVVDDLPPGKDPVLVLGDGKLAQLIVRALLSTERAVVVVGHHEAKLALLRECGAIAILEQDLGKDHAGMAAVVEATGSASGIALALSLTRPRGTVILKTTVAGKTSVDLAPVVINELRVLGSRCGDVGRAIATLERGRVDPTNLIAARYPLTRASEALAHAGRRGTLKVLVHP
jgi:threonine dehydrogenase-like Zn-dependent dehydrogenase